MRRVVVSAEAITSVDSTAEAMLRDLLDQLRSRGVTLELARPKKPLRDFLDRAGLLDEIGRDHVYPRVSDAVDAYLAEDTDPGDIQMTTEAASPQMQVDRLVRQHPVVAPASRPAGLLGKRLEVMSVCEEEVRVHQ